MQIKKSTLWMIAIVILIAVGSYFVFAGRGNGINEVATNNVGNSDTQKVSIGMKNSNYYPQIITVKQGIPVEITLDSSITGCFRSFVIRDFGVNKYSKNPGEKIVFTPDRKGTFRFACSMGMGTGTLIVE